MKYLFLSISIMFGLAVLCFSSSVDAQQRARTVEAGQQGSPPAPEQGAYAPVTQTRTSRCYPLDIWIGQSGLGFRCNGIAMAFDGGSRPGGIAAAASVLLQAREEARLYNSKVHVRHQLDPSNAACAEADYTHYESIFTEGECARVISIRMDQLKDD